MAVMLLSIAALVTAALEIRAEYRGPRAVVYVLKPLTTVLIVGVAVFGAPSLGERYAAAIVLGLLSSLVGDVWLMLDDRFVQGLTSFLLAHVAYLVAFSDGVPLGTAPLALVSYAAAALALVALLWPRLGALRVPVLVYVVVLVAMAWQATARAIVLASPASIAAAVGAALFVISDATLALRRFRAPFRSAQAITLSTYFLAQWLIAGSAGGWPPRTLSFAAGASYGSSRLTTAAPERASLRPTNTEGAMLTLSSSAFSNGGAIPARHTCDGDDVSPPLAWSGAPAGTKSFALIVDDPDAPDPAAPKRVWVHWVLYDLPPDTTALPEGASGRQIPRGAREGRNDDKHNGWNGPCPPIGTHRYFHKLYALDTLLPDLGGHATKADVERAMAGHILAQAELMGTYKAKR